jgi:hypothetical protein
MQKSTSSQTISTIAAGSRIACTQTAITIEGIVGLISEGGVKNAKLRVVENIERLNTHFQRRSFTYSDVPEKS